MRKFSIICAVVIIATCTCSLIRVGYSKYPVIIILLETIVIMLNVEHKTTNKTT